jgi:hypothetical protein
LSRDELAALRDAIDVALSWPDRVRDLVGQWLAPETAKPNGRDAASTPRPAEPRHRKSAVSVKAAERKLLEVMRASSDLTVAALAEASHAGRSATGDRLRRLAARGAVEKDGNGRWKLKKQEPRPTSAPPS